MEPCLRSNGCGAVRQCQAAMRRVPCSMTFGDGSLLIKPARSASIPPCCRPVTLARARLAGPGTSSRPATSLAALFFHTETALPAFDRCCTLIRVPPAAGCDARTWRVAALCAAAVQPKAGLGGVAGGGRRRYRRLAPRIHDSPQSCRELERPGGPRPCARLPAFGPGVA